MITYDETMEILSDIADEIPEEFYRELNGGIILLPDSKTHPDSRPDDKLYVLGEYHNDRKGYGGLGRYIVIYHGSFVKMYPGIRRKYQTEKLREVLIHEFTHHMESLSGERALQIKDARQLGKYISKSIDADTDI